LHLLLSLVTMQFPLRLLLLLLVTNISVLATNVWRNVKLPARVDPNATPYEAVAALLYENNKETPQPGRNYAFIEYWPGNVVEDICNGGSQ
jgi:hypothetical protein